MSRSFSVLNPARVSAAARFYAGPFIAFVALLVIVPLIVPLLLDGIATIIDPALAPLADIGISEPVLQTMLVSAILALSIYITLYGGMFSLANAGFMGIGAYTGAILTNNLELSLSAAILGGMIAAGIIALMVSLPVLRLRNIYLAIATIGFGQIVVVFFNRIDAVMLDRYRNSDFLRPLISDFYDFLNVEVRVTASGVPTKALITGGASGLKNIPQETETAQLILFLIVLCYIMYRLRLSRFGRALAAIRQDEKVAASQGINVVYYKNIAFLIGAVIAGAAGVFDAHRDTLIEPKDYGFDTAVDILAYAVLGGTQNWAGPVIGGLTLRGLPELLRELREYSGVITGVTLLLTIVYLPGGLASLFRRDFWTNGGRFRLAQRTAYAGVVLIFLANVLPYRSVETVAGRELGSAFLRTQARAMPVLVLLLGVVFLAIYGYVVRRWHTRSLAENWRDWQMLLIGGLVLFALYLFDRGVWYLAWGNLLPVLGLFWVAQTSPAEQGDRFAPVLAVIAGLGGLVWIGLGIAGAISGVMLGYYLHIMGALVLAAACLIAYPPEQPAAESLNNAGTH